MLLTTWSAPSWILSFVLRMNATSIFLTSLLAGGLSNGMGQIQLQSTATITPDSKKLVFAWAGDIWTSSPQGGEASRLTYHPAPDDTPKVSRDGKFVFFNSDRTGSEQVFRIPIQGGIPEQITFHSEGSSLEDLHPTKPVILVRGYRDHSGRRPYRLIEKKTSIQTKTKRSSLMQMLDMAATPLTEKNSSSFAMEQPPIERDTRERRLLDFGFTI